jgi:hypothetical protein
MRLLDGFRDFDKGANQNFFHFKHVSNLDQTYRGRCYNDEVTTLNELFDNRDPLWLHHGLFLLFFLVLLSLGGVDSLNCYYVLVFP